jgi:hypothetical protein
MNPTMTPDTYEQLSVSSERAFPAAPFPRKHVHSVFDDLQDAVQAVQALQAAGYDASDIHLMASWDYMEAVERRQTPMSFLSSIDEGFVDVYLHEARRGHYILAVRLSRYEQILRVRNLLAARHAHLVKYVDTWTFADLLP